jgi:hypothetical protein
MDDQQQQQQGGPAEGVLLDSLPYIDPILEEYEQYALHLIEEETMKASKPPVLDASLPPIRFLTAQMKAEYERVGSGEAAEKIRGKSFEQRRGDFDGEDEHCDLGAAVAAARTAHEAERVRGLELEAVSGELSARYRLWNEQVLQPQADGGAAAVREQRAAVDRLNLARRRHQQELYDRELRRLTVQRRELLDHLCQLKRAVADLEDEVGR